MSVALKQIESLLANISANEKAQVLQWVISDLGGILQALIKRLTFVVVKRELQERAYPFGCSLGKNSWV